MNGIAGTVATGLSVMDIDRFLQIAVTSGLLGADALRNALDEFMAGARAPASYGSDLVAFGDYLVCHGLLTRWQCQMLFDGRSSEFFLGNFRFLDRIGSDGGRESYLVDDMTTNRRMVLSFKLGPTDMAGTIYEIMETVNVR